MSYTIEVYRGNQKAEKHIGIYALYVMFYPQLVAGPIERPQNLLPQFREQHSFKYENVTGGLRLMLWGLFKKIVIADKLALFVDPVFTSPSHYQSITLLIGVVFFTFEIYCDFSGYSDIATGSAKVMGYDLMVNFDLPFRSKSITEFWRRWHISLSTWFYDYLFNPIITRLRYWGKAGIIFGLFITFFLSGLWHGAGWKFVIFGLLHGAALIYEYITRKERKRIFARLPLIVNNTISKILTISYATLAWIFFRAENVPDSLYLLKKVPYSFADIFRVVQNKKLLAEIYLQNMSIPAIYACLFWIFFLEAAHFLGNGNNIDVFITKQSRGRRWAFYFFCVFSILIFGVFDNKMFIYFQF